MFLYLRNLTGLDTRRFVPADEGDTISDIRIALPSPADEAKLVAVVTHQLFRVVSLRTVDYRSEDLCGRVCHIRNIL